MKVKEWEENVKLLGLDQKAEIFAGLKALEAWVVFKEEFKDTGIFTIKLMIENSLNKM